MQIKPAEVKDKENVDMQSGSAESIRQFLALENIQYTSLANPPVNIVNVWQGGAAILIVNETHAYILPKSFKSNDTQQPENFKNTLIEAILNEATGKFPFLSLSRMPMNAFQSLEDIIYYFFNTQLDYLYFSNTNAFISFETNISLAHKLAQKKIQLLESQLALEKINSGKKEQLIRALKYDLREYQVAMYIPGMSWIGKLGKLIQPRLGILYQYHSQSLTVPGYTPKTLINPPKISIVTPSFEQGRYLEKTLRSVLEQNYPNLEYVVKDGGSTDNSRAIIERYQDKLSHWVSTPDKGQSHAINIGFTHTSGDIMGWLNSDDLLLPGALNCVADYFVKHPEIDVLYGNRLLIDESDNEIGRWILPGHSSSTLSWADFIPQETLFWRRSIWDKIGGQVDESFRFAMDWDLLIRFREAGANFTHIPYFLGAFRVHDNQKTSAATDIGSYETKLIQKRIFGKIPSRMKIRLAVTPYILRHITVNFVYLIAYMLRRKKYKHVFNEQDVECD